MIADDVKTYRPDPPQVYVVLGMHRSATSAVALALERIGIDMNGGRHHCEDLDIMRLNDRILHHAGGSWDNPPRRAAILATEQLFAEDIASLVRQRYETARQGEFKWGFKDPRTCLTYELWRPHLIRPILISVHRPPQDVARSLQKRNGFDLTFGEALAKEYNRRIADIVRLEQLC